jgi:uncharacterized glyoxalase superfamily protein PhnB
MKSTTITMLRYSDAEAAIAWLCKAFGFEAFLVVKGETEPVTHARLVLENSMVMLASIGRAGVYEQRFRLPADVGGVTQATSIVVKDPGRIYQSAVQAGAKIVDEIKDFQFGGQSFSCEDVEGHLWVFTSHDPWQKLW